MIAHNRSELNHLQIGKYAEYLVRGLNLSQRNWRVLAEHAFEKVVQTL
jgi:hypothetical protein